MSSITMQDLKGYLDRLKKKVIKKEEINRHVTQCVRKVMADEFGNLEVLGFIKTFSVVKKKLIIQTTSKIFAQELYWRRENLKKQINQKREVIEEVIVL